MDFVISLGLLECHARPRHTQQKSAAPPAAHPLGKHAKLGPPIYRHAWLQDECHADRATPPRRRPAKCVTCAMHAGSPGARASLAPRPSGHACLPVDTPASSHPPQSHRTLLLIFATSFSPPKSAFLLTHFPFAESDVAPIPLRTPPAYHRNHPAPQGASSWPFSTSG